MLVPVHKYNECEHSKICSVPENIHTPLTEGIGNSWGGGGGGGGLRKNPFRRGGMDDFWNQTKYKIIGTCCF